MKPIVMVTLMDQIYDGSDFIKIDTKQIKDTYEPFKLVSEGFVISLGNTEQPNFVMFFGPAVDEDPIDIKQFIEYGKDAVHLINYLIETQEENPVVLDHYCSTRNNRIYRATLIDPEIRESILEHLELLDINKDDPVFNFIQLTPVKVTESKIFIDDPHQADISAMETVNKLIKAI